jgi:hypothetical protein
MNESQENAAPEFTERAIDQLIEQWQAGGKTRKEFCKAHNLHYKTFQRWCYARGIKRRRRASVKQETPEAFIPIELSSPPTSPAPLVEVSYPNGRKISFYVLPEVQLLQTLLG